MATTRHVPLAGYSADHHYVLETCFWCQALTGEVVTFKKSELTEDELTREFTCTSYNECKDCAEKWKVGIVLVEGCTLDELKAMGLESRPPIQRADEQSGRTDLYPSGRWVVCSREGIKEAFRPRSVVAKVLEEGRAVVSCDVFKMLAKIAKREGLEPAGKAVR